MKAIESILLSAGALMLDFQSPKVFDKGRHADFVTEGDLAVQEHVMEALQKAYPSAKFLAEEEKTHALTDALTFIIDPIDGTTNYFRRRACSMISIGAVENKQPVFAGLYNPYSKQMYLAKRGQGAYCNGERLHVSDVPLDKALIGFGTAPYYEELFARTAQTVASLLPQIADFRRTGSACQELCDIASGISDGHFEWRLQPWDYAAGTLLVEEAGGKCGDIMGGEVVYNRPMAHMAANARIFDTLQAALQRVAQ